MRNKFVNDYPAMAPGNIGIGNIDWTPRNLEAWLADRGPWTRFRSLEQILRRWRCKWIVFTKLVQVYSSIKYRRIIFTHQNQRQHAINIVSSYYRGLIPRNDVDIVAGRTSLNNATSMLRIRLNFGGDNEVAVAEDLDNEVAVGEENEEMDVLNLEDDENDLNFEPFAFSSKLIWANRRQRRAVVDPLQVEDRIALNGVNQKLHFVGNLNLGKKQWWKPYPPVKNRVCICLRKYFRFS